MNQVWVADVQPRFEIFKASLDIKHIEIIGADEFNEFHMANLERNEPNPTQKFLVVLNLLAELLENDEITIKHFSMTNFGKIIEFLHFLPNSV